MTETAHEQAGAMLTEGILHEAMTQGFAVADETKEALAAKEEPVAEEPEAPAQDAVDKIIAGIEAEVEIEEEEESVQMPDFEAEADEEILNMEIAEAEEGYEGEERDDETVSERKRRIIAEKKANFYENLTAERERSKWLVEARKHFPLSEHALGSISAKTRKGFLREAKAAHEAVKPYVKKAVQARETELLAEREQMAEQERAKAEAAWGKPVSGGEGGGPSSELEAEIAAARKSGDLAKIIAIQMRAAHEGGDDG